jgi:hypothetical protein
MTPKEFDESLFWLELMVDAKLAQLVRVERLLKEADELTAIFTAAVKTAKGVRSADDVRFQKSDC